MRLLKSVLFGLVITITFEVAMLSSAFIPKLLFGRFPSSDTLIFVGIGYALIGIGMGIQNYFLLSTPEASN